MTDTIKEKEMMPTGENITDQYAKANIEHLNAQTELLKAQARKWNAEALRLEIALKSKGR